MDNDIQHSPHPALNGRQFRMSPICNDRVMTDVADNAASRDWFRSSTAIFRVEVSANSISTATPIEIDTQQNVTDGFRNGL
jgi:hypothetical protein